MTLTFDEKRHVYKLDGVVLPGVTSILGVVRKPALEDWQRRLGFPEADRQRDDAADFGTSVHAVCQALAEREPLRWQDGTAMVSDEAIQHAAPYETWLRNNVRRVIAAEPRVASAQWGCAGSIDLVAEMIDGQNAIVDLKTGSMVPDTTSLQCAAYGRLYAAQEGIQATRRIAVHLPRKHPGELTAIEYPPEDEPEDWRCFLICLILYKRFIAKPRPPVGRRAGAERRL